MGADTRADEQAIRKLIDDWMQASAQGDLDKVLSMMSDDVVFMTAGREPFGKKEFAAQSQGMKDIRIEGVAKPVEIKVLGDWAYLRNHIDLTMTPKGGQPMKRSGYTLTILQRQSGRWVITRDANLMPR
ncbi:MAG TPA: SgcJ/EcaC family oxidoreductase [Steroidobacteraceae bacterium]|nr:SgcJ/EcaC family oxidoreductase [Steroidobacteraceae bacterium]